MKKQKLLRLQKELESLENEILKFQSRQSKTLASIHPQLKASAANLLHYLVLRKKNRNRLERRLGNLGIARLAKAQPHIHDSIAKSRQLIDALSGETPRKKAKPETSIKKSYHRMSKHSNDLLGKTGTPRRVRIMVTIPTEAADNYDMVRKLISRGMNVARINCAHDSAETWKKMIDNIRNAAVELERDVKISMDLGGPKIRTGELTAGPEVRHFTPKYDDYGRTLKPVRIQLVPEGLDKAPSNSIPIREGWLNELSEGDRIQLTDTRGRKAELEIFQVDEKGVWAYCYTSIYVSEETILQVDENRSMKIGSLPARPNPIVLREGDTLIIHRSDMAGDPSLFDEKGTLIQEAHVSCSNPELFDAVKEGESIYFDDGKIGGRIIDVKNGYFRVCIERVKKRMAKLKSDKGINLPAGIAHLRGLTEKDETDLAFVVQHADIVNVSFVNQPSDVVRLYGLMDRLEASDSMGVILKIETKEAFNLLPDILLEAMKRYPVGVMIARGDLAIEVGWDEIGRIQQEILNICTAAHVPVVWATQVLESLAKQGVPSRSEITDATQSLKAECVMLNKGAYTHRAVSLLDKIFTELESYQFRNETLMPKLKRLSH